MTMQSRYPVDPPPEDAYDGTIPSGVVGSQVPTGAGRDFLQRPGFNEPQTTNSDIFFQLNETMKLYLGDIRRELLKKNPDILCATNLQGPNPITSTATDLQVRTVKFLSGGRPVTVYKTFVWTNSAKAVRASFNGLSNGNDGFVIPATPFIIDVPIEEMQIALNVAGTIGVNIPSGIAADGSVFIFGFAIAEYINRRDYGEGQL